MYKGQPWTIADTHRHSRAITAELTAAKGHLRSRPGSVRYLPWCPSRPCSRSGPSGPPYRILCGGWRVAMFTMK